jgi:hypothetical protein
MLSLLLGNTWFMEWTFKEKKLMPTQGERITALERTTKEHRSTLQTLAYELTTVKGLITTQGDAIQDLKDDMEARFKQLVEYHISTENQIDTRFNRVETRLDKIEATMATKNDIVNMATKDDIAKIEATMATKDDMALMENRILNAFQQLVPMINPQHPQSE